ncbi:NUDIX domain-containing protein [Paenibacillus sinopodophylli]|uniref:NUDIX domain-containing protein n=1 Tax=Paenibacillus sinopodophylli TaxID=1837342 RepID=UPI001FE94C36|nr:NUDIX domain-containing protein [Paenibacillus sinopodophylli]
MEDSLTDILAWETCGCHRGESMGFPGYLGPGGKVDIPESLTEGAGRELREDTGLVARPEHLIFKGIDEYVVPKTNYR